MQDLRLAVRTLMATPVVSLAAVLSLALGIGANTALFSLVDSLVLRRLPVRDPDRLVMLSSGPTDDRQQYSQRTLDAIRANAGAFDGVCAWVLPGRVTFGSGSSAIVGDNLFVSGDFFQTVGVSPLRGRLIEPADDATGGGRDGPVAVISYAFWQRWFNGSPDAIGSRLLIERAPFVVVGVAPPDFFGVIVGRSFDVALPIRTHPIVRASTPATEDSVFLRVLLRLKPGQSLAAANAALRAAQPAIRAAAMPPRVENPAAFMHETLRLDEMSAGVSPLREQFERPLLVMFAVALLVLVVACTNIANLMLARGASRRHEMSVRLALGATRWQLARQLLVESAVVAIVGSALALLVAAWAGRAVVVRLSTFRMPIALAVPLDWRVLLFTALTMVATALLFGVVPALRAARAVPAAAVQAASRLPAMDGGGRFVSALIVGQMALTLALIAAAALLVRSFVRLATAPLGLDRDRTLVVTVTAPTVAAADRNALYHRLVRAAGTAPGVIAAGGSMNPPFAGTLVGNFVISEPGAAPPLEAEQFSQSDEVTPGFVAAYGLTLRAGREFDERDGPGRPPVAIVNEAFARRFLRDANAVGRQFTLTYRMAAFGDSSLGTLTVVGVVENAVFRSIRDREQPTVYLPLAQLDDPIVTAYFYVAVRAASGPPGLLAHGVTEALRSVNRDLTLMVRPMTEQVDASLSQDRLMASLAGFFGALAMVLAALGLYGVTAYSVAQRRTEIGIRMALGAAPAGIVRDVVGRVAVLVALGIAIGAVSAFGLSRALASLLYGLDARDPMTFLGAAMALITVSGLAAYVPAYRASRVDPAEVLRES